MEYLTADFDFYEGEEYEGLVHVPGTTWRPAGISVPVSLVTRLDVAEDGAKAVATLECGARLHVDLTGNERWEER